MNTLLFTRISCLGDARLPHALCGDALLATALIYLLTVQVCVHG